MICVRCYFRESPISLLILWYKHINQGEFQSVEHCFCKWVEIRFAPKTFMKRINHVQQFFALHRIKSLTKISVWKRARVPFDACVGAHKSHVQDEDFGGKTLPEPKQWAGLNWRRNENECKAGEQKLRKRWADGPEVWVGKYTETESWAQHLLCAARLGSASEGKTVCM